MIAIYNFFLDIFFPKKCVGCGIEGFFICSDCLKKIEKIKTSTCPECGKINNRSQFCSSCKNKLKTNLNGLVVSARYDSGPTKEMIHHLKYSGFSELAPLLGELIVQRIKNKVPRGKILIVPVPLYKQRERQRGFNQAEILARYLSERLKLPGGLSLERVKNTNTQVGFGRNKRIENLENAFVCVDENYVKGKIVLLVDDVATTSATLNECAKVLKKSGAKSVYGVVVAKRM